MGRTIEVNHTLRAKFWGLATFGQSCHALDSISEIVRVAAEAVAYLANARGRKYSPGNIVTRLVCTQPSLKTNLPALQHPKRPHNYHFNPCASHIHSSNVWGVT